MLQCCDHSVLGQTSIEYIEEGRGGGRGVEGEEGGRMEGCGRGGWRGVEGEDGGVDGGVWKGMREGGWRVWEGGGRGWEIGDSVLAMC